MSGGDPQEHSSRPSITASDAGPAPRPVWAGIAYLVIYLGLSWNWLASARDSSGVGINAADEPLVAWILGWVRFALSTRPLQLFDAPINYPAPLQLAASEHFLSTQLLFSPLYWLTGETLLSANLCLFLTYPIAALVMYRFLGAVGISPLPAFVLGLAFSLGPFQVPANLHLLQSLNLFLPLVALALVRLREAPRARECAVLAGCFMLAFLSSYYTAVITGVGAALWGAQELLRPRRQRLRYLVLATVAGGAAAALLGLFSLPYFEYRDMTRVAAPTAGGLAAVQSVNELMQDQATGWMRPDLLVLVAAIALLVGPDASRRCAMVAIVLLSSTPLFVRILEIPGLEFFRYPFRFAVLTGFGGALAIAAGIESVRARSGGRSAALLSAALAIFVLFERGSVMIGSETTRFADAPADLAERIRDAAGRYGRGPLLELPVLGPLEDYGRIKGGTESRSMLLALEHELPLIVGHSGYLPSHRPLIDPFLVPQSEQSLQHLVDATGLRWILVRPPADWPPRLSKSRDTLLSLRCVTRRLSDDGWDLLEIDLRPADNRWIESIRSGRRDGETVLGTPLKPLSPAARRGRVTVGSLPRVVAGKSVRLPLTIENHGQETWPAATLRTQPPSAFEVRAFATWLRDAELGAAGHRGALRTEIPLRWDLRAGASLSRTARVATPSAPGLYELQVSIGQGDGRTAEYPVWAVTKRSVEVRAARPRPADRVDPRSK